METIVRHRDEGQATWFLNGLMLTKADYAETGGAYCLMEHRLTAAANPPMHVHGDEEESFFVLEGEVEIEVDGTIATAAAGSFALLPRHLPHTFRVLSETARVLVIASAPHGNTNGGAPHFFRTVGEPAEALELPVPQAPDPVALTLAAADHGIEILPPQ
ncbi:MAG: cupin domain-containing protein [Actinobacteria bacterium]|nr:MAG: cupin domain-containing protein [Actinomycetota bacterium]